MSSNKKEGQDQKDSQKSLIYLIITSLLGSGGAGLALGLIGKGDAVIGLAVLFIFIFAAFGFYLIDIKVTSSRELRQDSSRTRELEAEESNRRLNLEKLNNYYVEAMTNVADFFNRGQKKVAPQMLKDLAKDLRLQVKRKGELEAGDCIVIFQRGTQKISANWEEIASEKPPKKLVVGLEEYTKTE